MSDTSALTNIDRLIEFVTRFDRQFPAEIRGASAEQIAELERWSGGPIPPSYREFLGRMGEDPSWLEIGQGDPAVAGILQHYRGRGSSYPGYVLIAVADQDPYFNAYLEVAENPPRVVAFPDGRDLAKTLEQFRSPLAGSLEDAVCSRVFLHHRLLLMPHQELRFVSAEAGAVPESVRDTLARRGMESHWFSNDWTHAAESATAAIHAVRPGTDTLTVRIGAESGAELNDLCEQLLRIVPGLRRV